MNQKRQYPARPARTPQRKPRRGATCARFMRYFGRNGDWELLAALQSFFYQTLYQEETNDAGTQYNTGFWWCPAVSASELELSPAEQFDAICDTLENVWLALTGNMKRRDLGVDQILDWVDMLQWAVAVMPVGYERQRSVIQTELDDCQSRLP